MGAHAAFQNRIAQCPVERKPGPASLDSDDRRLLGLLRAFASRTKVSPRLDLDRACALIAPCPDDAVEIYGATLLRALATEATRPVMFYRNPRAEPGFDELWLLRIVRLIQQGDDAGAHFLIAGRILPPARRRIAYLATCFASSLNTV